MKLRWKSAPAREFQIWRRERQEKRWRQLRGVPGYGAITGRERKRRDTQASEHSWRDPVELTAPKTFSLTANVDEMTAFLAEVAGWMRRGRSILIDLEAITDLTADAVVALLSLAERAVRISFTCTVPDDPRLVNILSDAGFFRYFKGGPITTEGRAPLFTDKTAYKVEAETAKTLVSFVTTALFGSHRPVPSAYEAMIEGMSNTHEHARPGPSERVRWWASANYDETSQCGTFVFVDSGLGILRTLRLKGIKRALNKIGVTSNAEILRQVLSGKIESSTGLSYRGKGLPKIKRWVDRGRLRELTIISNDVCANVSIGEYRTLRVPFDGTLLCWKLTKDEIA